ncbi:MAG: 4'-phosphopantetheinyl transferase superfamily protein [Pseudomonadota bacterium]|nr:4'-phosphopantetheinyl transferase superfamily protein [Pseudomonadota bacterium]
MITTPAPTLANVAEGLHDDEIHVWHLAYHPHRGRTPLRTVLAAYLGVPATDVSLIDGEHGRPMLAPVHEQSLGFNWSHSGEHALIAVGRHISPGIDIETQRDRPRALEIARRYFTAEEAAALSRLPVDQRHFAFLELWTAKEAVLKALGRGIAFGLHRLSIASGPDTLDLQQLEGDDAGAWQLQRLHPGPALIAALAWRGASRRIRQASLAIED